MSASTLLRVLLCVCVHKCDKNARFPLKNEKHVIFQNWNTLRCGRSHIIRNTNRNNNRNEQTESDMWHAEDTIYIYIYSIVTFSRCTLNNEWMIFLMWMMRKLFHHRKRWCVHVRVCCVWWQNSDFYVHHLQYCTTSDRRVVVKSTIVRSVVFFSNQRYDKQSFLVYYDIIRGGMEGQRGDASMCVCVCAVFINGHSNFFSAASLQSCNCPKKYSLSLSADTCSCPYGWGWMGVGGWGAKANAPIMNVHTCQRYILKKKCGERLLVTMSERFL
jgi:hypothetical protein